MDIRTSFDDFLNGDSSQLVLNGDAEIVDGFLRLTPDLSSQFGSVFTRNAFQTNSDTSFFAEFQFRIHGEAADNPSSNGETDGGDGFAFVVQNDDRGASAIGTDGSGLGYSRGGLQPEIGIPIDKSVAIAFDTFPFQQSAQTKIEILQNGRRTPLAVSVPSVNVATGETFSAWIDYDGDRDILDVFFSETTQKPSTESLSIPLALDEIVGNQAFLGFTAATGSKFNIHDIVGGDLRAQNSAVIEIESPVEPPIETPVEPPTEPPVEPPIEIPVEPPAEPPVGTPALSMTASINGQRAAAVDDAPALEANSPIMMTYRVRNEGTVPLSNVAVQDEDARGDGTAMYESGDRNANGLLDTDEVWVFEARGTAQDLSQILDFERDAQGNGLAAGTVVDEEFAESGITIETDSAFGAMIFDSRNPTGGDDDLAVPGDGSDPALALGNVLIVSEDGDSSDPDDAAQGGTIQIVWADPVRVTGVNLLDIDLDEGATVIEQQRNSSQVSVTPAQPLGDNSYQEIPLDGSWADRLDIVFAKSGAVTQVNYTSAEESRAIAFATAGAEQLSASDTYYYTNPVV